MFESEINTIITENLLKISTLGPYLTIPGLSGSGINPAIVTYVSAEIDYLVYSDRKKLIHRSLFDYSGDVIESLFSQISKEIKSKTVLKQEEVSKLIEQAVLYNLYYLLRPRWTLVKFIYNEEFVKTVEEIKICLNYIHFYPYIKEILLNFFDKKNLAEFTKDEFTELMQNLQDKLMKAKPREVIKRELKQIAEYLNPADDTTIPLSAVRIYLKEKEDPLFLTNLTLELGEETNGLCSLSMIEEIIFREPVKPVTVTPEKIIGDSGTTEYAPEEPATDEYLKPKISDSEEETPAKPEEPGPEEYMFGEDTLFGVLNNKPETPVMEEIAQSEIIGTPPDKEIVPETEEFASEPEEPAMQDTPQPEQESTQEEGNEEKPLSPEAEAQKKLEEEFDVTMMEIAENLKDVYPISNEPSSINVFKEGRKTLTEYFSEKESDRIMSECFSEDPLDFINTMEILGDAGTFEDAVKKLEEVPFLKNLKPDDKNILLIKEKLESYFNQ
ncbi:MAG: hypothetical protein RBR95_07820 [Ignavibacteriaceae bacterium]|jgi:hypothetical protein|nr:hypothetical protein [Ignavibacteriaceae bacterium]